MLVIAAVAISTVRMQAHEDETHVTVQMAC